MSQGDKSKYTAKQKRKAEHIEESYRDKGVAQDEAEARAWATVNKQDGGGKAGGGGRTAAERSEAAKKGARTRARNRAKP